MCSRDTGRGNSREGGGTLNRRVKQLDSLATRHRLPSGSRDPHAWQVVEYYGRMLGLDLTGMRGWATGLVAKLNKACAPPGVSVQ